MTITDNFGLFLTALLKAPDQNDKEIILVDTSGANRTVRIFGGNNSSLYNFTDTISHAQVGKGETVPTKQDFKLENPFTTGGAEDNQVVTTIAVQVEATGTITIGSLFSPTQAGTVHEAVKTQNWRATDTIFYEFLIFRNVLAVPVSFIIGESISLDTIIQL